MVRIQALIILSIFFNFALSAKDEQKGDRCASGICIGPDYEKMEMPFKHKVNKINFEMSFMDILEVNDRDFSIKALIMLGTRWSDPRIFFPNKPPENSSHSRHTTSNNLTVTSIDYNFIDYLWKPAFMVRRSKSIKFVSDLRASEAMFIKERSYFSTNGTLLQEKKVYHMQALLVTFLCPMRFNYFPLDAHSCKFQISSVHDTRFVEFTKTRIVDLVGVTMNNIVLEYEVVLKPLPQEGLYFTVPQVGLNYSMTGVEIILIRHKLKYLFNVYFPSGLFVVVSWASFLIPPQQVAGRMAMLITLFLVLINMITSINSTMPNVTSLTAISVWMIGCVWFVFGALACYARLLWQMRPDFGFRKCKRMKNREYEKSPVKSGDKNEDSEDENRGDENYSQDSRRTLHMDQIRVDNWCLVLFPALFALFNAAYWTIGLNNSPQRKM